ncbi:hypothetical protein LZ30DRAFT_324901 [Colletotrichum cereale]|nr:hypothetical protein LZ30DRAFT_324901 [Colletotrichum cereale]
MPVHVTRDMFLGYRHIQQAPQSPRPSLQHLPHHPADQPRPPTFCPAQVEPFFTYEYLGFIQDYGATRFAGNSIE